jgi:DNA-binding NtrC family response regulator
VEDIPLLADSFFRRVQLKNEKKIMGISNEAMELLMSYTWPGNVRELKSAFEYAFVTCQELLIQPHHLPPTIVADPATVNPSKKPRPNRSDRKKTQLIEALKSAGGNQSRAAEILGISRVTVWNRMKKYGITAQKKISS